jgi:asparagine synthase (glutamine-hydrolysing)
MCGILGTFGANENADHLKAKLSTLTHRGPDGNGIRKLDNGVLGHTRLAIIDVHNGQQPLNSQTETVWMVGNGEIYNHNDLRALFPDYDFSTQSDNEVIIPLWEQHGTRTAEMLDGMFAFALVDGDDHFYMARDPLGIKPLYYGFDGDVLHFASEIKTIAERVEKVMDFPPGHWYSSKHGLVKYYDVADAPRKAETRAAATVQQIREGLERAVEKRLMADVPLGVYLSGGLDSTIIAAIVAQRIPNVHSFAVGVEGSKDLEHARAAAKAIGTTHHECIYTREDMMEALPGVIYHLEHYDPSLVRSAIPNYFLARLTRQYVTVVLTGEGADELYAGYHYLKKYRDDDTQLTDTLVNLTKTLYNCNLQRCDRMTMAHSIEGRVPFLDTDFIELSFSVPNAIKISEDGIEKWALRKAFEDLIPAEVAWRVKEQFSKGAGSSDMLRELADNKISDEDFHKQQQQVLMQTKYKLRTKEEMLYHREFVKHFGMQMTTTVEPWAGWDVPQPA